MPGGFGATPRPPPDVDVLVVAHPANFRNAMTERKLSHGLQDPYACDQGERFAVSGVLESRHAHARSLLGRDHGFVPWSVEASNVITQAVAASRRERETRPVHLLVALSEGFGPIAAGLSRNGPLHAPDGGGDDELPRRVLTKKQLRGPLGDAIRRHAAASLRLPQVSAAAEGLAGSQGQSVLPAHLLVALLDQDDAEVRQATDANGLDHAALRRDALRELSAPDHLPTLRMPDLHWAPL
jgi:hypothetical protein